MSYKRFNYSYGNDSGADSLALEAGTLVVNSSGQLRLHNGTTVGGNVVGGLQNVQGDTSPVLGGNLNTNGLQITGTDGYFDLNGDGSIVLNASYTNVNINLQTTNGVYTQLWDFQASGNLVLPNSNIISSSQQTGETNIQIVDGSNSFKVYTHASDGAQEWDFQADGTFVVPGSVNSQANTGAVVINAHTGTTTKTWTFDVDGSLSIPGTVLASPDFKVQLGVPIDVGAPISSNGSWDANQGPNIATTGGSGSGLTVDIVGDVSGYTSSITIHTPGSGYKTGDVVTATSNGSYVTFAVTVRETDWKLSSTGNLTFPDSTVQPTAWLGYSQREAVVVTAYEDIAAGQAVMVHAITGGIIYAELADITEPGFNQESYLGIAPVAISSGTVGIVIDRGLVVGLDTSAYNEGDILWLNPDVPGGLIAAEPNPGTPHIIVGQVLSQSASNGSIYARADIRPYLNGLVDVNITNPTGGQVLVYSAMAGAWVNGSAAGGGGGSGISLGDLSVNVVPGSGGGSLSYDNATGVFTFAPASTSTFVTSSALNSYVLKTDFVSSLSNYVTTSVLSSDLSSYVTSTTLSGYNYATQSYVNGQGFITSSALSTYINNTATNTVLGAVKVGPTFSAANDGLINAESLLNGGFTLRPVGVPTVLTGSVGDTIGDIANDGTYLYYCSVSSTQTNYSSTISGGGSGGASLDVLFGSYPTPQIGWTVTYSTYGTRTITGVTNISGVKWRLAVTGGAISYTNGDPVTLSTAPASGNIWKKIPWDALSSQTTATNSVLGAVKVGSGLLAAGDGTVSVNTGSLTVNFASSAGTSGYATTATYVLNGYVLTTATSTALGGVKIGSGLTAASDGTISATAQAFNTATLVQQAVGVVTGGSGGAYPSQQNYVTFVPGNSSNVQTPGTNSGFLYTPSGNLLEVGNINVSGTTTVKDVRDTVYSIGTQTSGAVTINGANGDVQTATLTGNISISGFSSPVSGQTVTLILTQDATGGRTLTTTNIKFANGYKTLSTAPNAVDMMTISYIGTTYYASLVTNFV